MAQLSPVNWIYVFVLLWFCVSLIVALSWWGFSVVYGVSGLSEGGMRSSDVFSSGAAEGQDSLGRDSSWSW